MCTRGVYTWNGSELLIYFKKFRWLLFPVDLFSEYLPLRVYLQEIISNVRAYYSITNNNVKKRFYVYKSHTGYTKYKCKQKSSFFWLPWSATHVTKYSHVLIVLKDIRNPAKIVFNVKSAILKQHVKHIKATWWERLSVKW